MVTVKWGKDKIAFDLPHPDTPLSEIRSSLAEYTHLAPDAFKLIHAGAVMRDDSASISAYKLHPNSVIVLVGAADPNLSHPASQRHTQSEQSVLSTIQSEIHVVRNNLLPDLDHFVKAPTNHKELLRIAELLLQSLIRLDTINSEPSWEAARRERKEAVKEVQAMLDRLDNAWTARNAAT